MSVRGTGKGALGGAAPRISDDSECTGVFEMERVGEVVEAIGFPLYPLHEADDRICEYIRWRFQAGVAGMLEYTGKMWLPMKIGWKVG